MSVRHHHLLLSIGSSGLCIGTIYISVLMLVNVALAIILLLLIPFSDLPSSVIKLPRYMTLLFLNLAHVCIFILEWTWAKQINPLIPEEHGGGVRGSSIHRSGKASKPLDRSGPNLAHVYRFTGEWTYANKMTNTINPSSPNENLEGVRGSQIQKCTKDAKQLYRPGTHLAHVCMFIWEWT